MSWAITPGGAGKLSTLAGIKLDVMHEGADRDIGQRQRVAGLDVGAFTAHHHIADLEALRGDDIALLAALVLDERDVRRTVGVVLEGQDGRGNTLHIALEVDDAVFPAVGTAAVADGDAAGIVAAGRSP